MDERFDRLTKSFTARAAASTSEATADLEGGVLDLDREGDGNRRERLLEVWDLGGGDCDLPFEAVEAMERLRDRLLVRAGGAFRLSLSLSLRFGRGGLRLRDLDGSRRRRLGSR